MKQRIVGPKSIGLRELTDSVRQYLEELIDIYPIKNGFEIVATHKERIEPLVFEIKQRLIILGPDFKDDLKIAQIRRHAEMENKDEPRGVYFPEWGGIKNRNQNIYKLKVAKINTYQS